MIKLIREGRANVEAVAQVGVRSWFVCFKKGKEKVLHKGASCVFSTRHGEAPTTHRGILNVARLFDKKIMREN